MIPRFRPDLRRGELVAALARGGDDVVRVFERCFAERFGARDAVSFSYGRTALWAFLQTLGLRDAEVVQPAYTCVVVTHATVLSGNTPRFVDAQTDDYNMDLADLEAAITPRTRAVIATHLFGYPMNVDRVRAIVRAAEEKHGHKIWVIQDCAHSFGARWEGRLVCSEPDVALYGLNISKTLTSIFGGMLAGDDVELLERVRHWRDAHCKAASSGKSLRRRLYLLGAMAAFSRPGYALTHWLQSHTPALDRLTKAYHLDDVVRFPPDHLDQLSAAEAHVGIAQLERYDDMIAARRAQARAYVQALGGIPDFVLPPLVEGATYSHFPVRVAERGWWTMQMARRGIELGRIIDYSIPHMSAYAGADTRSSFPVSLASSRNVVNLPLSSAMSATTQAQVVDAVRAVGGTEVTPR